MEDHEIEAVNKVYSILNSNEDITPELRSYMIGRLEQVLAPYKVIVDQAQPKKKFSIKDLF